MSKRRWYPTYIKLVRECKIESSTQPLVVLTDKGWGYFKALGNPEGPHCLARELVATSLAELLDIPTLRYGILNFSGQPEIHFSSGVIVEPGPGFITKEVRSGEVWKGPFERLQCVTNPADITRLVCLDTWVRNPDRYCARPGRAPHVRVDNVFFANHAKTGLILNAFDFSHALFCERDTTSKACDEMIYGLFPYFKQFIDKEVAADVCEKIKQISEEQIRLIINEIPEEWMISSDTREAWIEFLMARAYFLSRNFLAMMEV